MTFSQMVIKEKKRTVLLLYVKCLKKILQRRKTQCNNLRFEYILHDEV